MNLDNIFLSQDAYEQNKIDLVYTFVNPKDVLWKKKYYLYNKNINKIRFDFGEEQILFSLRSIKKYMNWVNKIFIVSDNQRFHIDDDYLSQKIVWIDHKDIIPQIYLPTFNSMTIEAHIGNIQNLHEYFLYLNDDMFLGKPVYYSDFFENNYPIQFYAKCRYYAHPWIQNIKSTNNLFRLYYKNHKDICPQHCPLFIQKSVFLETKSRFEKFLLNMFKKDKIRTYQKYAHNLIYIYGMYSHYKKKSINKRTSFDALLRLKSETIERVIKNRKKFYCFYSPVESEEEIDLYKKLQEIILS